MENKKEKSTLTTKELTMTAIFTVLTAVMAQIAIPLPFSPVPISFGLVAVYMTGILLKPKHAVLAQVVYLFLGAVGVPVFGGFKGGIGALFGPTGGYLLVYPIMALIVSMSLNSHKSRQAEKGQSKGMLFVRAAIAIIVAHLILYIGGTTWLSITTGNTFVAALAMAVIPFIPLDIVKILFCVFAVIPFRARMISLNLLMLDEK